MQSLALILTTELEQTGKTRKYKTNKLAVCKKTS